MLIGSSLLTRLLGVKSKIRWKVHKNPDTSWVYFTCYEDMYYHLMPSNLLFLAIAGRFSEYLLSMVHETGNLYGANHI